MHKHFKYIFVLLIFTKCSTGREVVMPFKNVEYTGARIFPVKTSNSEFAFRIWISNSTSIDRVITISMDRRYEVSQGKIVDSLYDFTGYLTEFGQLYDGKSFKGYFRQINVTPKSGYENFKRQLEQLKLMTISSQEKKLELPLHEPFSTYVVEYKDKKQFNSFKFNTYYPRQSESEDPYKTIERLIFYEFNLSKYFQLNQ